MEAVGLYFADLAKTHPALTGWFVCTVVLGLVIVNVLRVKYPDRAKRPPVVAYLLVVFDATVGNFWSVINWITGRIGLKLVRYKFDSEEMRPSGKKDDEGS